MNCIFCKIIDGEIPSYQVYESEKVYAFLDITPKSYGHTLVIPKAHSENLLKIDTNEVNIMQEIQKIAKHLKERLAFDGINLVSNCGTVAGQEVFHTHYHLIPRYADESINDNKNDFEEILNKLK